MLGEDTVQEVLARVARSESIKAIARELGVDHKTVKRWRRLWVRAYPHKQLSALLDRHERLPPLRGRAAHLSV